MATILMHADIETRDAPMYLNAVLAPAADARPELLPGGADVPLSPDSVLRKLLPTPNR